MLSAAKDSTEEQHMDWMERHSRTIAQCSGSISYSSYNRSVVNTCMAHTVG